MPCRTGTFAYLHTPNPALPREIQANVVIHAVLGRIGLMDWGPPRFWGSRKPSAHQASM
jgi:hypothetical protein